MSSEILRAEDEVIEAAETRMVELGAQIAQNMLEGKDSPELCDQGQRIRLLKRAYHDELEDKEKEAVLYCLRKLSEAFDVPAVTRRNLLGPIIPEVPEVVFEDFYIGSESDAEGHIGTEEDAENYISA